MRNYVFAVFLLTIAGGMLSSAPAAVRELTAEVHSEVRQFVAGAADSFDEADETFGDTGVALPINTRANLQGFETAGAVSAEGVALADFRDPTQGGPQRNPGEIGIEADCYSNDPDLHFEQTSSVLEKRLVSFTAADLGNPAGGTETVHSALFASGAIFAWSRQAGRDLTGLSGTVSFVVRRFDIDESGNFVNETELVSQSVSLRGGPNGTIAFENTSGLFVFNGDVSILPDDVSQVPSSIGLDTLAVSRVAVILQQDIEYEYEATVDQEFKLEAEFTTSVANVPDGTGVVAVFGRTFDEVIPILEAGIPAESARTLGARLNRAILEFKVPQTTRPTGNASPCGVLGMELLPMLGFCGAFFMQRTARRGLRRPMR